VGLNGEKANEVAAPGLPYRHIVMLWLVTFRLGRKRGSFAVIATNEREAIETAWKVGAPAGFRVEHGSAHVVGNKCVAVSAVA